MSDPHQKLSGAGSCLLILQAVSLATQLGDAAEAWDANHETPPTLMGQVFHYIDAPSRFRIPASYEPHVSAWKQNPNGMFAAWNPKVSCEEYTVEANAKGTTEHNSGH